uniref:Uncharacterized protein n=1 Tax=Solanum lycopersicum TaxID=4081 RepID=A0A3Q7J862_SOLLC
MNVLSFGFAYSIDFLKQSFTILFSHEHTLIKRNIHQSQQLTRLTRAFLIYTYYS